MSRRREVRNIGPGAIEAARELRKEPTQAEAVLWEELRGRRILGLKFRRQYPIGSFILDFVCPENRLVIELDGVHHHEQEHAAYDSGRTEVLAAYGYTVMRFSNDDVIQKVERVLEQISGEC